MDAKKKEQHIAKMISINIQIYKYLLNFYLRITLLINISCTILN
jgi:hypothetical protein